MKPLYWRGRRPPLWSLLAAAAWTVGGTVLVERWPALTDQPHAEEKRALAQKTAEAFEIIGAARKAQGPAIDPRIDPLDTGVIGLPISPVTSNSGHLPAKQTSVNPNFAALIYDLLRAAEIGPGDLVAVGVSGSFPALNAATYVALEGLEAKPLIIASASASEFGANVPGLLWIDMERRLAEAGVISSRAMGASLGGTDDQALGMSDEGRALLMASMNRNGVPFIGEQADVEAAIERRMALYREAAKGAPIKAYINVGGSTVSLGGTEGRKLFKPGLSTDLPKQDVAAVPGVMARFAAEGRPVIHLAHVEDLARKYGLPIKPAVAPAVGEGQMYARYEPRRWLAILGLLGGALLLILGANRRAAADRPPQ